MAANAPEYAQDSDLTPLAPNREALTKSNWLKHINGLLDGVGIIARQVGLQHSHVLIHCSDGWDRTSQLSALSQLCLDPYYRTLEGFIVLVEKDWVSFGHQFAHRSGFLSSEKWFNVENERITSDSNTKPSLVGQNSGAGNALENALLSAKGFFNQNNNSRDSLPKSDDEMQSMDTGFSPRKSTTPAKGSKEDKSTTKVKETSPIFHQFLDATYQLLQQHPTRFEYNERFLRRLLYHVYSCQYGTFLYNNEKERVESHVSDKTRSVWDYFIARRDQFLNDSYDVSDIPRAFLDDFETLPKSRNVFSMSQNQWLTFWIRAQGTIDDHVRGKERLILPASGKLRWWNELFGRTDAEMNGPARNAGRQLPGVNGLKPTIVTGVETAEKAIGSGAAPTNALRNGDGEAGGMAKLAAGLGGLGVGEKGQEEQRGGRNAKQAMEVEMQ